MGSSKYNLCELRPNMLYKLFFAYFLACSLEIIGDELQEFDGERAAEALSQGLEHAMDRDVRDRLRADMEAEFLPDPSPDTLSQVDRRMANAAEYVAYHLGQIDRKLDRLITLLENTAREKSEHKASAQ
jgi:hypothetical protein